MHVRERRENCIIYSDSNESDREAVPANGVQHCSIHMDMDNVAHCSNVEEGFPDPGRGGRRGEAGRGGRWSDVLHAGSVGVEPFMGGMG